MDVCWNEKQRMAKRFCDIVFGAQYSEARYKYTRQHSVSILVDVKKSGRRIWKQLISFVQGCDYLMNKEVRAKQTQLPS